MAETPAETETSGAHPGNWHEARGYWAWHFRDADEAAAATPGADMELSPTHRSGCQWGLRQTSLGASRMLMGAWPTALVANGSIQRGTLAFVFGIRKARRFAVNGCELGPDCIAVLPEGLEFAIAADDDTRWAAFQVSMRYFETLRAAIPSQAAITSGQLNMFQVGAARQVPLYRTLRAAVRFAGSDPTRLQDHRVCDALERTLVRRLVACLQHSPRDGRRAQSWLVRMLVEHLRENRGIVEPMDLCRVLGIGDRALRRLFAEVFGMSPAKYLRLRRLHHSRRLLEHGGAGSVSQAGTALGFFDLGRFAADYRRLFGELPSTTLRRVSAASTA